MLNILTELDLSVELTGQRVKLLSMTLRDAEGLFAAVRDFDAGIWTYMPLHVTTLADMTHLVQQALDARQKGQEYPFVIFDQQSQRLVGSTRFLDISIPNRNLEIGWTWLAPDVWRTRINTECKYLLLKYCFETLDLLRVQLKTDGRNLRSQQAIERIGGTKEGVLRHHRIMPDGYIRDSVYYGILAEEWPAVKARLETWLR